MMVLLLGILVSAACYGTGRRVLRSFNLVSGPWEEACYGLGLGLGILGYGVLAIGLLHVLTPLYLWVLLGIMGLWGIVPLCHPRMLLSGIGKLVDSRLKPCGNDSAFGSPSRDNPKLFAIFEFLILALSMVSLAAAFSGVLAPETANDSLCYHLNLPKQFLRTHQVFALPYDVNAGFPLLMEMLYTLGLGIGGAGLAKFFHLLTGLITAGCIAAAASRMVPSKYGKWAGLLFLTTPGILNQLGTTYVDVGLACFTALALAACLRGLFINSDQEKKWMALGGVFCGLALSIKFLAISFALAFCALIALESWLKHKKAGAVLKNLLSFMVPAALFSFFWYLRSFLIWGNPVYPYFYQIFKIGNPVIRYDDIGLSKSLFSFLTAPWFMTLHPAKFEGFGDQIGPAYLALAPLAFLKPRGPAFRPLIVWSAISFTLWFYLGQSMRFFFPVLPALAVLMARGMATADAQKGFYRIFFRMLLIVLLGIHAGLAVFHFRKDFKVASGRVSQDTYLAAFERSYGISQWVNRNLPLTSKILAADESHAFYFNIPLARETNFALQTGYARKIQSLPELFSFLKKEGFTHLLLSVQTPRPGPPQELPPWSIPVLFNERQNEIASYVESLYTTQFKSFSNLIEYKLYKIR